MTGLPIMLLLVTSILLIFISRRVFGLWFNPVVFFVGAHFLHNWISNSFALLWYVEWPVMSTPESRLSVTWMNFFGLIAFSAGAMIMRNFGRPAVPSQVTQVVRVPPAMIFEVAYWIIMVPMIIIGLGSGGGGAYGEGQALTVPTAVNIGVLFLLRVPCLILGFTIRSMLRQPTMLMYSLIVFIEVVLAMLHGGRKSLFVIMIGMFFAYIATHRLNFRLIVWSFGGVFAVGFLSIFIGLWRGTKGMDTQARIGYLFEDLGSFRSVDLVVESATSASSEGLQSWVHNLWFLMGAESMQFGKTYIQAILNTVVPRNFQGEIVNWQAAYLFRQFAQSENMGFDFAFAAEALINFGPIAGALSFLALGIGFGAIHAYWRNTGSIVYGAAYITALATLTITLRTDSASMFRFFSFIAFPLGAATFVFGQYMWVQQIPTYRLLYSYWDHLFPPPVPHQPEQHLPAQHQPVRSPPETTNPQA